jgi:hypothetical protein
MSIDYDAEPWLPAHNSDLYVPCDCDGDPLCTECGGRGWAEEPA